MKPITTNHQEYSRDIRKAVHQMIVEHKKNVSKVEILNKIKRDLHLYIKTDINQMNTRKLNDNIIRIQKYSKHISDKTVQEFITDKKNNNIELLKSLNK